MNIHFPIQIDQQKMLTFGKWQVPLTYATKFSHLNATSIRVGFQKPAFRKSLDLMCQTAAQADEVARHLLGHQIVQVNEISDTPFPIEIEKPEISDPLMKILNGMFMGRPISSKEELVIIDLGENQCDEVKAK